MKTYSLAEAAEQLCGDSMKDPALWLRRKIRRGDIAAIKVGHTVRLTEQQLEDAVAALTIGPSKPQEVARLGVTAASLRRRSA